METYLPIGKYFQKERNDAAMLGLVLFGKLDDL